MGDLEAIIIGGGIAGLAAARALTAAGLRTLVIEAQDRVGGRIHSSRDLASHPVELGAEFVHGENVLTWDLIRGLGLRVVPIFERPERHGLFLDRRIVRLPEAEKLPDGRTLHYLSVTGHGLAELVESFHLAKTADTDVATLLQSRDVDLATPLGRILVASYEGVNAADPAELSAASLVEADYEGDGDTDFRIDDGYDRWLGAFARDLPITLGDPVDSVSWSHHRVEVSLRSGRTWSAPVAIITLPLAVLQNGSVKFAPALPAEKQHAMKSLGSGPILKIVLRYAEPFWPDDLERVSAPLPTRFFWRTGFGRSKEEPLLTVFLGGKAAQEIAGNPDPLAQVTGDLKTIFGRRSLPELRAWRMIDWAADPFAQMGYSFVRPNGVGARDALAAPVDETLFFAGEATHAKRAATVHGAAESGFRAGREVLARLAH